MKTIGLILAVGSLGVLTACAQQEEFVQITPQPTFDKFGTGSCEDGYIYVPGANQIPECIPDDECEDPVFDSTGQIIDCPPPFDEPDDDDDDQPTGQTATGGPVN